MATANPSILPAAIDPQEPLDPNLYYRISDLPNAAPIVGTEVVEAIQGGKNVKFTLSQLLSAGKSAYEVAVSAGFVGTQAQWLASLKGKDGIIGKDGVNGLNGADGTDGVDGVDGRSAYEAALAAGFVGTELQWLASLKGANGVDGTNGVDGINGLSAYDLAVEAGFEGTEEEFLEGLKGDTGASAYEIAMVAGFEGTEQEWLDSLHGADGLSSYELALEAGFEGTEEEFLASLKGEAGQSAYELAVALGFVGDEEAYLASLKGETGEKGIDGDAGVSAYATALELGFEGTEEEWIASLKGETGGATRIAGMVDNESELPEVEQAEEEGLAYFVGTNLFVPMGGVWEDFGDFSGPEGLGLNIRGTIPTMDFLPIANNEKGDTFIIEDTKTMFVWDTEKWSEVGQIGPKGYDNFELAVKAGYEGDYAMWAQEQRGEKGEQGEKGDTGEKGEAANSLKILGRIADEESLPQEAMIGDAYFVGRNVFTWDGEQWFDCGELYAKSTYDIAVEAGFEGTEVEWLQSLVGAEGKQGIQGEKGDTGKTGPSLRMLGPLDNVEALPDAAEAIGDAYLIGGNTWVFGEAGWFDAGIFRGPQGIEGPRGPQGSTGATGMGLVITGEAASMAALPQPTQENPITVGTAYVQTGQNNVFVYGVHGWFSAGALRGADGRQGERGFQGAQGVQGPRGADGYRGQQGIQGPRGYDGLRGLQGPTGKELVITGRKTSAAQLPAGRAIGTAYIVKDAVTSEEKVWIMGEDGWFDAGFLVGPQGAQGDRGLQGPQGLKGDTGAALNLQGTKATVGELPGDALFGQSWLVNGDIHFKTASGFVNLGPLRGATGATGERGLQGLQGLKGDQGAGLTIRGTKDTVQELPLSATIGDAWMVEDNIWIFGTTGWFDGGPIGGVSAYDIYLKTLPGGTSPLAEADWVASLKGEPGERGESGAAIAVLGSKDKEADLPNEGNPGDAWIIGEEFFVRTSSGQWEAIGGLVGPQGLRGETGPVGKQGIQGLRGLRGEVGRSVLLGAYNPTAGDGNIGDVFMNTNTQGVWLKTTTVLWSFVAFFGGGNVYKPDDMTKTYVWQDGWKEFNRYDLNVVNSTGICDLKLSNVFLVNNSTATAKAISFANLPTGRATTIVVLVSGKVGNVTWPTGVQWSNGEAPVMADVITNVVFLYDGARLIGSVGASA